MSHNSKYYVKRLTKNKSTSLPNIKTFLKRICNEHASAKSSSEAVSPTQSVTVSPVPCSSGSVSQLPVAVPCSSDSTIQLPTSCSSESQLPLPSACSSESVSQLPVRSESQSSSSVFESCQDRRKFAPIKYERDYKWLYYSTVKNGYMCKYCDLFGAAAAAADKPFVKRGTLLGTHPTRKLLSHANSKYHKFSVERFTMAKSSMNVYRQLQIKDVHKKKSNRSALKKMFKCLDFLIRQKWAVTENAEKFIKFIASIGVTDLQEHLSSGSRVTYLSSTSITEMIMCLSDYLERQILSEIQGKEFSLLADESPDISNRSQMSVMIRCGNETANITTFFVGFIQLQKGTAACITNSLETFLLGKSIDAGNIRLSGFDGCNTMSGACKGVQRRIQHLSP